MEALRIVQKMVWGPWLLGLFLAVGVLCMVRLRGFPIRHIRVWWGETVGSGGKGQLLTTCTALAATVGTGNITGVAAALAIGGPGAVFWMWAAAFLGMALAYTEVYLGILYGGGPYVYLENGVGSCFAGKCYALFCVLASLGMGCMVQADGSSILNFSGISGGMTGYGMAAAIRSGVSRGVFSNEAGLGSLAVLHGMSEGKERLRQRQEAQKQGMWAIFEVFFDTIIGCSLTAFLLLCVFPHNLTGKIGSLGGSGAVAAALAARFGNAGGMVTAACMVLFAFATILAWFYIGDQALGWLMRDVPQKRADKICILYHGGYLVSVFLGCVSRMEAVWAVSDIFNGLMAVPNLAALVVLGRKVRRPEQ